MRVTRNVNRFVPVVALAALSLAGCTKSSPSNEQPDFWNELGWATENIDPSFWTRMCKVVPATAFRDFWIPVDDTDGPEDITFIQVTDPLNHQFILQNTANGISHYDSTGKFWGGYLRWYDSDSPSTVALGVYDETTYTGFTAGGTPMLRRAASVSGTWEAASTLRIDFRVADGRVHNGYVRLFDASGVYLGGSGYFRNTVNGGAGINVAGLNSLTLHAADLDLGAHPLSDVGGVHVVLVDGIQYAPDHPGLWDHRSISAYATF